MLNVSLRPGDCLDVMAEMPGNSIDTIITDPPYGLEFMGKDWDRFSGSFSKNEDWERGNLGGLPRQRQRNIKCPDCDKWIYDHPPRNCTCGGVKRAQMRAFEEFSFEWAKAALRVAKPGALLLAFGGTRTHHRLMCAIEDAGWEIRDTLMWLHGQGFPKGHDISKAIDKAAGVEREVAGERVRLGDKKAYAHNATSQIYGKDNDHLRDGMRPPVTIPVTEAAQLWDGWNVALKPSFEPIILAMKPRESTFAANALAHGVAGLWIDGCRVGTDGRPQRTQEYNGKAESILGQCANKSGMATGITTQGRWPPNVLLSHSEGCVRVGVKRVKGSPGHDDIRDTPARSWKNSSIAGIRRVSHADADGMEEVEAWECVEGCAVRLVGEDSGESNSNVRPPTGKDDRGIPGFVMRRTDTLERGHNDHGTAARFYPNLEPDTLRFKYQAKASRKERNAGLEGMEKAVSHAAYGEFAGTPEHASNNGQPRANHHPTVKPLALMRWLCRLTKTPLGGIVLDPFMGSGTTGMAAIMEGRDFVGIEIDEEYLEIARRRIAWAQEQAAEPQQLVLERMAKCQR